MTRNKLDVLVESLGGTVEYPAAVIKLPQTLRIKTKVQALDLLDVLINSLDCENITYQINHDTAYKALKAAIKRGGL